MVAGFLVLGGKDESDGLGYCRTTLGRLVSKWVLSLVGPAMVVFGLVSLLPFASNARSDLGGGVS